MGGCNGASEYYGTGNVDFYSDSDERQPTGQWSVVAVIPDCPGDFLWKWRVTDGNYESIQAGDRVIDKEKLKNYELLVIYSAIGGHSQSSYSKS